MRRLLICNNSRYKFLAVIFAFAAALCLPCSGDVLISAGLPLANRAQHAPTAALTALPLGEFVQAVQKSYHQVHALRADFTQTYQAQGGTRTESGTVVFARGGKMRWDYSEPKKIFVSDGHEVLFYLPEEKQLRKSSVKASEDFRVPFRLLLSRVDLSKVFSKFEDAGEAIEHPPQDRVIRAYPKNAEKVGYKSVLIEFDPRLDIRRLEITYTDNAVMKFAFSDIKRNPLVSAALFQFTPPPGTEIIAQH